MTESSTISPLLPRTTIPDSVRSIGNGAFSFATSLTSITIHRGVTSIGEDTFLNASSLTSISIPNTVESIGNGAFNGASSLASITIPNSVTSIGDSAFSGASSLTTLVIPNSVASLGEFAFEGTINLASITIPSDWISIGDFAFYGALSSSWNGAIVNLTPATSYTISILAVSSDGVGESKSLTFKTATQINLVKDLAFWNSWLKTNTYFTGEAARLSGLLTKFNSLEVVTNRSYLKVPTSRVVLVVATSLTPKSCSVVSATAKVDAGLVKAITNDVCTISYTVSGPSKAPATLVKSIRFKKIA